MDAAPQPLALEQQTDRHAALPKPSPPLPQKTASWRNWIDQAGAVWALRGTGAIILALWIAFALQLDRPNWAVVTAVFLIQDDTGQTIWRSAARFLGTIVGAVVAVALVGTFVQERVFMLGSLALFLGCCGLLARFESGSDAYAVGSAGLTALVIAIDSQPDPTTAITIAIARVTEICVGIIGAFIASILIAPRSTESAVLATASEAQRDFAMLVRTAVAGQSAVPVTLRFGAARRLVALNVSLKAFSFERSSYRIRDQALKFMTNSAMAAMGEAEALSRLLRTMSSAATPPRLVATRAKFDALVAHPPPFLDSRAALDLSRRFEALAVEVPAWREHAASLLADKDADPAALAPAAACYRLRHLALSVANALRANAAVSDPRVLVPPQPRLPARYGNWSVGLVNGLRSMLAFLVAAAFWIVTAWPSGSLVTVLAGTLSLLLPILLPRATWPKVGTNFATGVLVNILPLLAVLALLPSFEGFVAFAVILGSYLFILLYVNSPLSRRLIAISGVLLMAFGLQPTNTPVFDPLAFLNLAGALLTVAVLLHFSLTIFPEDRPRLHHLLRRGVHDLLKSTADARPEARAVFLSRAFNLLAEYGGDFDPSKPEDCDALEAAWVSILIGSDFIRLEELARHGAVARTLPARIEGLRQSVLAILDAPPAYTLEQRRIIANSSQMAVSEGIGEIAPLLKAGQLSSEVRDDLLEAGLLIVLIGDLSRGIHPDLSNWATNP